MATWTCPGCGATITTSEGGSSHNITWNKVLGNRPTGVACPSCQNYIRNGYSEKPS